MSRGKHDYSEKGKHDYSATVANKADRAIPCSGVCCCFLCSEFMCCWKRLKYVAVTSYDVDYVTRLCHVGDVTMRCFGIYVTDYTAVSA